MNRIARRSLVVVIFAALLVSGLGFFVAEYFTNAGKWIVTNGSPHVYQGGNIGTGTVVDRDGALLLDMTGNRTYSPNLTYRMSTMHWLGDRLGFISAPALPHYAKEMAGFNTLDGMYSYTGSGGRAELTISGKLQSVALEALGEYKGTVAVYNYKTGQILCAVTSPTYDPDNVPDISGDTTGAYEGVYLNRFTQSVYIPGSIFKIVTLAAALEADPQIRQQTFQCNGIMEFGIDKVTCERAHGRLTLQSAMTRSCNCAFAQIALKLGAEKLHDYVQKFQLTQRLTFDGITTAAGTFDVLGEADVEVAWSAIGQHHDQMNPARFLTFLGAVAGGGKGALPHLVEKITVDGAMTYQAETTYTDYYMSEETAALLAEFMRNNVLNNYGAENFPGLTVCAKTGTSQLGGDKTSNAMFAGFVTDEEYPLAFFVAVEGGGYGKTQGVPIMSKVLAACKEMMDTAP